MNEPNPAWVNAPLEEARWDVLHGHHWAREKSNRVEGNDTVIELELTDSDGKVIGVEERRFPRVLLRVPRETTKRGPFPSGLSGEWTVLPYSNK